MHDLLNWFRLEELWQILALIVTLIYIGGRTSNTDENSRRIMRRAAYATFVSYVILAIVEWSPSAPLEFLVIVVQASLACGLVFGLTLVAMPILKIIESVPWKLWALCARRADGAPEPNTPRVLIEERPAPEECSEPEIKQEDAAKKKEAADAENAAQKRREEAHLRSELLYERHSRQLATAFPRDRFEQFLDRYMGSTLSPDLVEQREVLLKEMIVDLLGTGTAPKFVSMSELADFFAARRQEISALPHAEDIKDTYIVQLNKQEDEALRRFLKP